MGEKERRHQQCNTNRCFMGTMCRHVVHNNYGAWPWKWCRVAREVDREESKDVVLCQCGLAECECDEADVAKQCRVAKERCRRDNTESSNDLCIADIWNESRWC